MSYNPVNPNGQATKANSSPIVIASDDDVQAKLGIVTETAPASDTASSGLNGRLQRVAQRISSLITALGSPFQAGGSIGNTSFGATQATASSLNMTEANSAGIKTGTDNLNSLTKVLGTDTYTEGTTKGTVLGAVRRDANTTLVDTTNEVAPIQVNATGEVKVVHIQALPTGTNVLGALSPNQTVDVAKIAGTTTDVNSGTKSAGTQRVVIATDQPQLTNALKVDGSAVTQPVSLTSVPSHAVTNAGTFAIQDSEKIADDSPFTVATSKVMPSGYMADETATDSVDEGDIGIARMTLDRKVQTVTELESNSMRISGTAVTPKFKVVTISSSGANTVIALVSSKKIRVLAAWLMANGTVNAKWQSHLTPTDLTGLAYLVANTGLVLPYNPAGWFESIAGEALDINLSAGIAVGGSITYIEV